MVSLPRRVRLHAQPPDARDPLTPGGRLGLLDPHLPWQLLRLARHGPRLPTPAHPAPRRVLMVPGWAFHEVVMSPLARYLRRLGHHATGWGLGTNRGDPEGDTERLLPRIREVAAQSGQPVTLVGWSLGGVIAREAARELPDLVNDVITYGTPVVGGPTFTIGRSHWGEDACARLARAVDERDRTKPIRAAITAIFTRADRVVDWPACIDRRSPSVLHVEVASSHVGMGFDPDVWRTVAWRLAQG
jgi:pimeloyl-ACP methyl ester carboxylesterase